MENRYKSTEDQNKENELDFTEYMAQKSDISSRIQMSLVVGNYSDLSFVSLQPSQMTLQRSL